MLLAFAVLSMDRKSSLGWMKAELLCNPDGEYLAQRMLGTVLNSCISDGARTTYAPVLSAIVTAVFCQPLIQPSSHIPSKFCHRSLQITSRVISKDVCPCPVFIEMMGMVLTGGESAKTGIAMIISRRNRRRAEGVFESIAALFHYRDIIASLLTDDGEIWGGMSSEELIVMFTVPHWSQSNSLRSFF
jgi:hypothetical protein